MPTYLVTLLARRFDERACLLHRHALVSSPQRKKVAYYPLPLAVREHNQFHR